MDIISSYDLRKYGEILDEIDSAYEKSEQIKKEIQQVENRIVFSKLSLSSSQRKISHVNVKVFDNVPEIINLYDLDTSAWCDLQNLHKCSEWNFLLVEIFITKSLLERLTDSSWRLQISASTDGSTYSKVISLGSKNSILEIIPVSINAYECSVDTCLMNCFEEEWNIIDLYSTNVDVSYHFQSYKERDKNSVLDTFLNITKLYNAGKDLNCVKTPTTLQRQMKCNFDNTNFVPAFVKNSYHRLNLEIFSDFINDIKRVVNFQFSISDKKVIVLYHKDTNVLKVKCSSCQMLMMMNFFQQYHKYDHKEFENRLQKLKEKKDSLMEMDTNEIISFYQELRKLWL